jgi:alpha-tubulin suppressor-like RCC1 family protein
MSSSYNDGIMVHTSTIFTPQEIYNTFRKTTIVPNVEIVERNIVQEPIRIDGTNTFYYMFRTYDDFQNLFSKFDWDTNYNYLNTSVNLMAWYKFDEFKLDASNQVYFEDSSLNSNDINVMNNLGNIVTTSVTFQNQITKINYQNLSLQNIYFQPVSTTPIPISLDNISFSVCFWIYRENDGGPKIILGQNDNSGELKSLKIGWTSKDGVQGSNGNLLFSFGQYESYSIADGETYTRVSEGVFHDFSTDVGKWVHLTFTYDSVSAERCIYRNGVKLAITNHITYNDHNLIDSLFIGKNGYDITTTELDDVCYLEDFRIYSQVLEIHEIMFLCNHRYSSIKFDTDTVCDVFMIGGGGAGGKIEGGGAGAHFLGNTTFKANQLYDVIVGKGGDYNTPNSSGFDTTISQKSNIILQVKGGDGGDPFLINGVMVNGGSGAGGRPLFNIADIVLYNTDDMHAIYTFNNNFNDNSGNENHILQSIDLPTISSVLYTDGPRSLIFEEDSNHYITVPDIDFTSKTAFSVSIWVYIVDVGGNSCIIDFGDSSSEPKNIILNVNTITKDLSVSVYNGLTENTQVYANAVQLKKWEHIVFTIDKIDSNSKVYVNNEELTPSRNMGIIEFPISGIYDQCYIGKSSTSIFKSQVVITENGISKNPQTIVGTNDYYYAFTSTSGVNSIEFPQNTVCDVLIVGGGGGGGNTDGGGGSSGGLLYATNQNIPSDTYLITVGEGGIDGNGGDSVAFGATAIGGSFSTTVIGATNNGSNIPGTIISWNENKVALGGGAPFYQTVTEVSPVLIAATSYSYYAFTTVGINGIIFDSDTICDVLIIGGGGQGGGNIGGGGGAGGVVYVVNKNFEANKHYKITVGGGGDQGAAGNNKGDNGTDSSITTFNDENIIIDGFNLIGYGGGGGGYYNNIVSNAQGNNGGSGGGNGESHTPTTIVSSTSSIQGNTYYDKTTTSYIQGGNNGNPTDGGSWYGSGGGGMSATVPSVRNGRDGILNDITGANIYYAAGGGGGRNPAGPPGTGGLGGGGDGGNTSSNPPKNGVDGTGSGGGGNWETGASAGGKGGSGIVIIRVPTSAVSSIFAFEGQPIAGGGGGIGSVGVSATTSTSTPSGGDGFEVSIRTTNELFAGGGGANGGSRVPPENTIGYGGNSGSLSGGDGGDGIVIIRWTEEHPIPYFKGRIIEPRIYCKVLTEIERNILFNIHTKLYTGYYLRENINLLYLWYNFENSFTDNSGNQNNATQYNDIRFLSGINPRGSHCIQFDGGAYDDPSAQYLKLPSFSLNNDDGFTISLWMNFNDNTSDVTIFDFKNSSTGNSISLSRQGATNNLVIIINEGATQYTVVFEDKIVLDQWLHFVTFWTSDKIHETYFNNTLTPYSSVTGSVLYPVNEYDNNYIAKSNDSKPYFKGMMDDFRIYKKDLFDPDSYVERPPEITGTYTLNTFFSQEDNEVYEYVQFTNNGTIKFNKDTECEILIVGGGGGGGGSIGGGGGGGAVIHIPLATLPSGDTEIEIVVGNGGSSSASASNNGGDSKLIISTGVEVIAKGGGGVTGGHPTGDGKDGGSGGGAAGPSTAINTGGNVSTESTLGTFTGNIYGNKGGDNTTTRTGSPTNACGGGGAGTAAPNTNPNNELGHGGDGILINIDGNNYYWGGGGAGAVHSYSGAANGGKGGGGGGNNSGEGGLGGINNGSNGAANTGGNGGANTGGGGGGGGWQNYLGGTGGSGIVIIKWKKIKTDEYVTVKNANVADLFTNNMIAHYTFDNVLTDGSGNENHAIDFNTPVFSSISNPRGSHCIQFDGGTYDDPSAQYLKLPSFSLNNDDGFTISLWMNFNDNTSDVTIFDFKNSSTGNSISLSRQGATNNLVIIINEGATQYNVVFNEKIVLDQWIYFVTFWTSDKIHTTYFNKTLTPYSSVTGSVLYPVNEYDNNYIARSNDSKPYFKGMIDDFRIYKNDILNLNPDSYVERPPEITGTYTLNTFFSQEENEVYEYVQFTNNGTIKFSKYIVCDVLIVGGGGGGGFRHGAGGGAGGLIYTQNVPITENIEYNIVVGGGGRGGYNSVGNKQGFKGGDSSFNQLVAIGGGAGTSHDEDSGRQNGGSGGGSWNTTPGTGVLGQGNAGGQGSSDGNYNHGGGGGAGQAGGAGTSTACGKGGDGREISITEVPTYYAGGGGGGSHNPAGTRGLGGAGGGGNGGTPGVNNKGDDGVDGTGGGGGGASTSAGGDQPGGNGGSGIVIIRWKKTNLDVKTGLEVEYKFNNNFQDSSQNGNHAVAFNNPLFSYANSFIDVYSVRFQGGLLDINDPRTDVIELTGSRQCDALAPYLKLPTLSLWDPLLKSNVSFSFWIYIDETTTGDARILEFYNSTTEYGIFIQYKNGNETVLFSTSYQGSNNGHIEFGEILPNKWYHIAIIITSNISTPPDVDIYINGNYAVINENTLTGIAHNDYDECFLSPPPPQSVGYFIGDLDNFKIYKRSIDAQIVRFLSTPSLKTNLEDFLLINYKFEKDIIKFPRQSMGTTTITYDVNDNDIIVTIKSSSNYNSSYDLIKAFDGNILVNANPWISLLPSYVSGQYPDDGTHYIKTDYRGEYLMIDLGEKMVITQMKLYYNTSRNYSKRHPRNYRLYGSNDALDFTNIQSENWIQIFDKIDNTAGTTPVINPTVDNIPQNTQAFQYYTLVVNKVYATSGSDHLELLEWELYGYSLTIQDYSIYNHHAIPYNNFNDIDSKNTAFQYSTSLSFNGIDQYLSVPTIDFTSNTALSISCWVYIEDVGGDFCIFDFGDSSIEPKNIIMKANTITNDFSVIVYDGSTPRTSVFNYSSLTLSTWNHIAFSISNDDHQLYVNNEQLVETSNVGLIEFPVSGTYDQCYIGRSSDSVSPIPYFKGRMIDFRVFFNEFTTEHVKYLYEKYNTFTTESLYLIENVYEGKKTITTDEKLYTQYNFENNFEDKSGNTNDVILGDYPTPVFDNLNKPADILTSLSFDGISQYLHIPGTDFSQWHNTGMTISLWVYIESTTLDCYIINFGSSNSLNSLILKGNADTNNLSVIIYDSEDNQNEMVFDNVINSSSWTHIGLVMQDIPSDVDLPEPDVKVYPPTFFLEITNNENNISNSVVDYGYGTYKTSGNYLNLHYINYMFTDSIETWNSEIVYDTTGLSTVGTGIDSIDHDSGYGGAWFTLEFPQDLFLKYVEITGQGDSITYYDMRRPKDYKVYGLNSILDTWEVLIHETAAIYDVDNMHTSSVIQNPNASYKKIGIVINKIYWTGVESVDIYVAIQKFAFYGYENQQLRQCKLYVNGRLPTPTIKINEITFLDSSIYDQCYIGIPPPISPPKQYKVKVPYPTIIQDGLTKLPNRILDSDDYYFVFNSIGTHTIQFPDLVENVDVLIIGGGGGGGGIHGSGGGAGGLIYKTNITVSSGVVYDVVIGDGGDGGVGAEQGYQGDDSSFNGLVAIGGGGGQHGDIDEGRQNGGSGGGGIMKSPLELIYDSSVESGITSTLNTVETSVFQPNSTNISSVFKENFLKELKYPPIGFSDITGGESSGVEKVISQQMYGNGTYKIEWSSGTNSLLFNGNQDETGGQTGEFYNNGNIITYDGTSYHYLVDDYYGEWISLEFPEMFYLTVIKLFTRQASPLVSPKNYKIYGQNDDLSWDEILHEENANYINHVHTSKYCSLNKPYIKYGLVVNQVFTTGNILNFSEIEFYGNPVETNYPVIIPNHPNYSFIYDTTDMLAWYKFDGDFTDSSGNGKDLTQGTGTSFVDDSVVGTNSINLQGTAGQQMTSTVDLSGNKSFSTSFWSYRNTNNRTDQIISTNGPTASNRRLHIGYTSANTFKLDFWGNAITTNPYTNDINKWTHWICTYNSTDRRMAIYKNGVLENSKNSTADSNFDSNTLIIGSYVSADYFYGKLDDVRIYNRALTPDEISQIYKPNSSAFHNFHNDTSNMYVWYKFDDDSNDSSGYNRHATQYNTPTFDDTDKKEGTHSISFAGGAAGTDSQHLTVPSTDFSLWDGFTVSTWVYFEDTMIYGRIIDFGNGQAQNNIVLTRHTTTNKIHIEIQNGSTNYNVQTMNDVIVNNTWMHVVWTISKTPEWKLYINGVQQELNSINFAYPQSEAYNNCYIARSNWDGHGYFKGKMDDFRIYDRALIADEVSQIYKQKSIAFYNDTTHLYLWYKFDGDSNDNSGYNRHALEYNTITFDDSVKKEDFQAISFSGTDSPTPSYLQIPPVPSIDFSLWDGFTLSFWAYIEDVGGDCCIIDFRDSSDGAKNITMIANTTTNNLTLTVGAKTSVFNYSSLISSWNHIAFSISNNTPKLNIFQKPNIISCGLSNTVYLDQNGNTYGFGYDGRNQLEAPPPENKYVFVACGQIHTVYLDENGNVYGKGVNTRGILDAPPPENKYVFVACDEYQTVYLDENGNVYGKGANFYKEIDAPPSENKYVFVACGRYQTVYLDENGNVYGKGANYYKQIDAPPSENKYVFVACGERHTVYLDENGNVYRKGTNSGGILNEPPSENKYVFVACGRYNTVYLDEYGNTYRFGSNDYNKLTAPPPENKYVFVACQDHHIVYLDEDGAVYTVGSNESGQRNTGSYNYYEKSCELYVNNQQLVKTSVGFIRFPVSGTYDQCYIGKHGTDVYFFKGKIDDFRLYTRVLTVDEISSLYDFDIYVWYKFDGNSNDSSGYNRHATQYNTPTFDDMDKKEGTHSISFAGGAGGTDSQHLTVPSTDFSLWDGFTVSTWVYFEAATHDNTRIIDFGDGEDSNNIILARNGVDNKLMIEVLDGSTKMTSVTKNDVIVDDTWMHIAWTIAKSSNKPERMYPPVRNLASNSHTISGESYGNGLYETSSTPTHGVGPAWTGFNTAAVDGFHAGGSQYSGGNYVQNNYIVIDYKGDWLKIKLPVAINLTKYGFKKRPTTGGYYHDRAPAQYKIYGSNDNINWTQLVYKSSDISFPNAEYYESIGTNGVYQYFVLVVNRIAGGTVLNFDEWYIYGIEEFEWKLYVNGIQQSLNSNSFIYPVSANYTNCFIAKSNQSTGGYFKGKIDDFRLYKRTLSPYKIRFLSGRPHINDFYKDTQDLLGWYKFENSLIDSSGNGKDFTEGVNKISFEKYDYVINVPNSFDQNLSCTIDLSGNKSFSVSFWSYKNDDTQGYIITSGSANSKNQSLYIGYSSSNTFTMAFYANDLSATALPNDVNIWIHWTVTYNSDDGTRYIYKNGIPINNDISDGDTNFPSDTFTIGTINGWQMFNGKLDDLRVYDRALLSNEVLSIFLKGRTLKYNGFYGINDMVGRCFTKLTNGVEGCLWEGGGTTIGAYLGLRDDADQGTTILRLRAGDATNSYTYTTGLTHTNERMALLDIPYINGFDKYDDDNIHEVVWEIRIGKEDEYSGRVRLWIDRELMKVATTYGTNKRLGDSITGWTDGGDDSGFGNYTTNVCSGEPQYQWPLLAELSEMYYYNQRLVIEDYDTFLFTYGIGTQNQGYNGGFAYTINDDYNWGGGGGAREVGGNGTSLSSGNGGDGLEILITGSSVYYAGGGGGGSQDPAGIQGFGGQGGGGNGGVPGILSQSGDDGQSGTGGGGGGASTTSGGDGSGGKGGSGTVIIRWTGIIYEMREEIRESYFKGNIADFRIYRKSLSPPDIDMLYHMYDDYNISTIDVDEINKSLNEDTDGSGNDGGVGLQYEIIDTNTLICVSGGGGGGIDGTGFNGTFTKAGHGGYAKKINILGIETAYGGGGGGIANNITGCVDFGQGGGVEIDGSNVTVGGDGGINIGADGIENTGSGGGASLLGESGKGANGVVIIKWSINEIRKYEEDPSDIIHVPNFDFLTCKLIPDAAILLDNYWIDTVENTAITDDATLIVYTYWTPNGYQVLFKFNEGRIQNNLSDTSFTIGNNLVGLTNIETYIKPSSNVELVIPKAIGYEFVKWIDQSGADVSFPFQVLTPVSFNAVWIDQTVSVDGEEPRGIKIEDLEIMFENDSGILNEYGPYVGKDRDEDSVNLLGFKGATYDP